MKKSLLLLLAMLLSISLLVVACGGEDEEPTDTDTDSSETDVDDTEETTEGDVPQGGTVTYGFTQPFAGVFDWAHYGGQDDSLVLGLMHDTLFSTAEDLMTVPHAADFEISEDGLTVTISIQEGILWHDGNELTAEDMVYTWQVIAHPDYTGDRWSNVEMIVGASDVRSLEEYDPLPVHELEGVNVVDSHTIELQVNDPAPNTISNLWTNPMPSNHYEGIAVADLEDSEEVRRNPVGFGPFKVTNIVPGEMVEMERFDDYWQGPANLDGVVYRVVDGAMGAELVQQGEVDILEIQPGQAVQLEGNEAVQVLDYERLSYSYIGFKLGHWNGEEIVMDNPKFEDVRVRQAFAYAIDREGIINAFSDGYGVVINAPESVISWAYPDESTLTQYDTADRDADVAKANELLDEAGYSERDADGWRLDPDGNPFTVNFMAMSGSDISEPRATYIVQNLQDVGVNAKLQDGQLFEMNLFYDLVEEDHPDIDLFMGAWGLSADPDPTGLWRKSDAWNFPRWYSETSEELIREGLSLDALDPEYRTQVYQEWHQHVNEELPMIPLFSPIGVYAVNANVQNVQPFLSSAVYNPHLWYRTDVE
ncbi:oligopeptide ABC transporter substrate-binding protein [Evansella tamaricis]|uniref:Oligopeptide ABC transporter substrate-binding protein n=1 Tax=Evansella tamaricis TaxID=2069301 RepID=A0ABS6JE82_9BACI|nr:oligopeptide ABC transporter substrate-binding protein [Evansella tamaricis]MBU9710648.1 oligopeptide ABC transporter substrate-binding protein [Evansella tamaricis]